MTQQNQPDRGNPVPPAQLDYRRLIAMRVALRDGCYEDDVDPPPRVEIKR